VRFTPVRGRRIGDGIPHHEVMSDAMLQRAVAGRYFQCIDIKGIDARVSVWHEC
jgi:hypothetical protein